VGLTGRPEVRVHTQVDSCSRAFEPGAAPSREMGRLIHLREAQYADVEEPRRRLLSRRHRQLDVVEPHYDVQSSLLPENARTMDATEKPSVRFRKSQRLRRRKRAYGNRQGLGEVR
jgi:hypothetical protein